MPTFPITPGPLHLPDGAQLAAVDITNDSPTDPAAVTITAPDGRVVVDAQLAPAGTVRLAGLNGADLDAGAYLVDVTGTVTGTVDA